MSAPGPGGGWAGYYPAAGCCFVDCGLTGFLGKGERGCHLAWAVARQMAGQGLGWFAVGEVCCTAAAVVPVQSEPSFSDAAWQRFLH